jgi:putative DNA primase/helicase
MKKDDKPFYQQVAEKLIAQLKQGRAPWQRPWEAGEPNVFLPMNPLTGKRYKGINAIQLMSQNHTDQRWMTYKQAISLDAQVRKGEKGTVIQYWKFTDEQNKTDDNGNLLLDNNGKPVKEEIKLERPRVFFTTVFNAEQIDGLPPIEKKPPQWNAHERAEKILQASGAVIRHIPENKAFYSPSNDYIKLPDKHLFSTADEYYATAFHELGHWTGHYSRLARDLSDPFGSQGYAKEKLRAEISSMILGDELGIGHDPGQRAAYVNSWIKILQDEPLEIFRAAADAEKIQEYVLGLEQKQIHNISNEPDKEIDDFIFLVSEDKGVADAFSMIKNANSISEREILENVCDGLCQEAFGFKLPHNWSGKIEVVESESIKGWQYEGSESYYNEDAETYSIYALTKENEKILLVTYDSKSSMQSTIMRLSEIDEYLHLNEDIQKAQNKEIIEAWKLMKNSKDSQSYTYHEYTFSMKTEKHLGFSLPDTWTGEVKIKELFENKNADGSIDMLDASLHEVKAQVYALYAYDDDYEKQSYVWVKDYANHAEATEMSERLKLIGNTLKENLYLNVPYNEKDEAKSLGAKWDREKQSWYIPEELDRLRFLKWLESDITPDNVRQKENQAVKKEFRQYLVVPYGEREAAKAAGAFWDKAAKSWCAGHEADLNKLRRWLPENILSEQTPAMTPREEFTEALRTLGCIVSDEHPVMDGSKRRISIEGDKNSEKSGFYVAHLDGHPAGYIKNNRTGIEMKWKSKGYSLNDSQKAKLQLEAEKKLQLRKTEQAQQQEEAAQRVRKKMSELVPIIIPTPYMQSKGIKPQTGIFTDNEAQKTYIPVIDEKGKQWSIQTIQEDGTKRFAKNGRKEGCFHAIGGLEALLRAPVLVIAEGYATAASLSEVLGYSTVAAFDAGNLEHAAKALHAEFPDKPIVIAGDNDKHVEVTQGINPGKTKAEEAARAVGGKTMFPIFTTSESALSEESKQFTDFNDLVTKSELGREGLERQVQSFIEQVICSQQVVREKQQGKQESRFDQHSQNIQKTYHEQKSRRMKSGC